MRKMFLGKGFLLGILTHACAMGLMQDWHGQEGYIELVRTKWADTAWWHWIVALLVILVVMAKNSLKATRLDKGL